MELTLARNFPPADEAAWNEPCSRGAEGRAFRLAPIGKL